MKFSTVLEIFSIAIDVSLIIRSIIQEIFTMD